MLALNRVFQDLKMGKAFLGIVKDPNQTEKIFELSEAAMANPDRRAVEAVVAHVMSQPGASELYEERYMLAPTSLKNLADLPSGTLGREYYDHMTRNQLKMDFFPVLELDSPMKYIAMRARQSHDVWHVVAGHDTSIQGELALQAFSLAQIPSGLSASLLAAGLLHYVKNRPADLPSLMGAIVEGYTQGKSATFLLTQKWERRWSEPLDLVRSSLGISMK